MSIQTWEEGAELAADSLLSGLFGSSAPVPVLVDELKRDVRLLREDHFDQGRIRRWFFGGLPFTYYMRQLADTAISLMDALRDEGDEVEEAEEVVRRITWLIARKQHDYGHGNITAFGERGLVVRINDKIERLANLLARGDGYANESIEDTLDDIVGYALIGIMLNQGTFTLTLSADLPGSVAHVPAGEAYVVDPAGIVMTPAQFAEVFGDDAEVEHGPASQIIDVVEHADVPPNTAYLLNERYIHTEPTSFQQWLNDLAEDELGDWR